MAPRIFCSSAVTVAARQASQRQPSAGVHHQVDEVGLHFHQAGIQPDTIEAQALRPDWASAGIEQQPYGRSSRATAFQLLLLRLQYVLDPWISRGEETLWRVSRRR